jgi:serine/threonine protein kinase
MSTFNLVGQTLGGRYQIQSLIGQGGMASVYKAYDPNLHRSVAIKVIHPHLSNNQEFFRRFEEEATAVAHLRHANIVQMYDFNHDGDQYYMVMEFVMGETLQTRLRRLNASGRHLSIKETINFTAEICDAAYYAHQRGMIHRDIKPANIMLDVNGRAILMDFGIARIVGASQHTASGAVLGTAMYMSPEQIQGLHTDARADIYSIGVTLFEMLSGKPPFEADSAMTLMMMHLNDPVPDLLELQPNTPPELIEITNKALAKNRDERWQSANEMANALRRLPDQVQKAQAAVSKPTSPGPMAPEATIIETEGMKDTGETILEAGDQAVPVKEARKAEISVEKPIKAPAQAMPTLQEQVIRPVEHQTTPAAEPTPQRMPAKRQTPPAEEPIPERKTAEGKKSRAWVPILVVVLVVILGGGGYVAYRQFFGGGGLFSRAATPTMELSVILPAATNTALVEASATLAPAATETAIPSLTPTEAPTATPAPLVIGGADKIAFLSGRNVWVSNLDGSELVQLTQNNTEKNYLRWLPDGLGLTYISGKCIEKVSLAGEISRITCFNNADKLEGFEVSPNGEQVAIGLDSQVYLVPFNLEGLSSAYSHDSLAALATCENMAPYAHYSAHFARWTYDSRKWALVAQIPYNGVRADVVAVFPVDVCYEGAYPALDVQFPPPHFNYAGYDKNPFLQDIGFDGNSLFAFHGITRNDGFGDLHIFNMETFKFSERVNPINGACCYRDAAFSPDGSYLVFAFQDIGLGQASTTRLYYIPFGSIGTGEQYEPLPLPDITDPRERPQPVLRPVNP